MSDSQELGAQILAWDSNHFGEVVARLDDNLPATRLAQAHDWCLSHDASVIYALQSVTQVPSIQLATSLGYRFTDARLTFGMDATRWHGTASSPRVSVEVRETLSDDLDSLCRLARVAHRNTRFRADLGFSPERCDEVYAEWIRNAFADPAVNLWTALSDGHPAGYLSGLTADESGVRVGRVSLIAVDESCRGAGVGRALVSTANERFVADGCQRLLVGTQGSNEAAVALYSSAGYCLEAVDLWHHWRRRAPASSPP